MAAVVGHIVRVLDGARFTLAVRPLRPQLVKMIERRVGQMADAEDIVQEALEYAWQKWRENGAESFAAFPFWLRLLTINRMNNHFRGLRPANDAVFDPEIHDTARGTAPSPLEILEADERAAQLGDAIARLPVELRHVLIMREIELLTPAQVAEALNISNENVRYRTSVAKCRVLGETE